MSRSPKYKETMLTTFGPKPKWKRASRVPELTRKVISLCSPEGILGARRNAAWWRNRDLHLLRMFVEWQQRKAMDQQMALNGTCTGNFPMPNYRPNARLDAMFEEAVRGA